jgi:hypothetical protein
VTYGDEQERASEALLAIIRSRPPASDLPLILACRRQTHLALADRIETLRIRKRLELPERARQTLDAARYPVELISDVLRRMPKPAVPDVAPSEVMAGPAPDSVAIGWQALARHLTVGNADLRRWADDPRQIDKRRWYLVADLATTLEGMIVADQRLVDVGCLPARRNDAYLQARLAMANVARVALWHDTDPAPDHAVPDAPAVRTIGGAVISIIQTAEDFPFAQRNLAQLMRPISPNDSAYSISERHGLQAARAIASGQIRLANVFAEWAARADAPDLADRFSRRIDRYADLDRAMKRLIEKRPIRSPHVVAQQSEMVQQLGRHIGCRPSPFLIEALDEATHRVAVNVGKSLRPESMQRRNILVFDDDSGLPRPITSTRERFYVACRRLAEEPALSRTPRAAGRHHRDRLAIELSTARTDARQFPGL